MVFFVLKCFELFLESWGDQPVLFQQYLYEQVVVFGVKKDSTEMWRRPWRHEALANANAAFLRSWRDLAPALDSKEVVRATAIFTAEAKQS